MSSAVREALAGFVAGRVKAEQAAAVVASAFYADGGRRGRTGEVLQGLMEVIERAAPGVVELARTDTGPGFAVRLAERPFSKVYESEFKRVAEQTLARLGAMPARASTAPAPRVQHSGLWSRVVTAVRRLFNASA